MRQVIKRLIMTATLAMVFLPTYARAEGYVNPWSGVQFGSQVRDGRGGFGVSAGGMGTSGVAGGELVFGLSPSFFGSKTDFGDNTVVDVMGNVLVAVPITGTRGRGAQPYVTAGMGLIHTQIDGGNVFNIASSTNHLAYNVGGGAMGFFNRHVGVRGDLRYLRTLQGDVVNGLDLGDFHFWRMSAGVVIR